MVTSATIAVAKHRGTRSSIRAYFGAPTVILMSVVVHHLGGPSPRKIAKCPICVGREA